MSDIPRNVVVRRARANDVAAITMLVNGYAAQDVMLPRTAWDSAAWWWKRRRTSR